MRVDPWSKLYFYIQNKILGEARLKLKALDTDRPQEGSRASYILVCKHIDHNKIQDAYQTKRANAIDKTLINAITDILDTHETGTPTQ